MNKNETFGRRASSLLAPASLIALEGEEEKAALFVGVDALLADVLVRALRGEVAIEVDRGRHEDRVSVIGLDPSHQAILDDLFAVTKQHARGAWFLPEKVSLPTGLANLPSTFVRHPRFATGLAGEDQARVLLANSPAGVFVWAVLDPLFEQLFMPFELRGPLAGSKSREDQLAAWALVDEILSALGLDVRNELAVMRYGGGWSRLRAAEQLETKQHLLAALAAQANREMADLYRAYRLLPLMARYYSKAKNGRARRQHVLTRALEKTLAGFFGGDWLRFLDYLGEEAHPDEEIDAAIPEPKLFVGGTKSASTVAAEVGVPAKEVERVLSTYWNTAGERTVNTASPVEERVAALNDFWMHFDQIHSRQAPGMRSLWGLVEEGGGVRLGSNGPDWYNPRLYEKLLPNVLVDKIEQLWSSTMLPRWPDRIVSEISPHALMAEAFGSAIKFWHGSALTAWFVCEGPMSRTDMAGLAAYHEDALAELQQLRCPVNPALFAELREAESHLGPPEPLNEEVSSFEATPGISFEMRVSTGSRRSGFERLRDIITRYRRTWAERYLESYLRARWESELREAARLHSQYVADKGKPPTAKQFAKHAAAATNHWFGGDLSAFYAAVGEKSPVHPVRVFLMPGDRLGFANRVFESLGGRPFERKIVVSNREEGHAQAEEQDRHTKLVWLAVESLRFIQLEEALGRLPELKEFGTSGFEYRSAVLSLDVQQAWDKYATAVEAARVWPSVVQGAGLPGEKTSPHGSSSAPPSARGDGGTAAHPEARPNGTLERRPWLRRLLGR